MAIDNLENRCLNRKEKSVLKYQINAYTNLEDPKNFNLFKQRSIYAKSQLVFIEQYLQDFQAIVQKLMENPSIRQEIKRKKDNNEII